MAFEAQETRIISAKGDSIPNPKNIINSPVWWSIQGDVGQTTDFALDAVSDMADYLDGSISEKQLTGDINDYKKLYNTTLEEIQQGKLIDK